ncbi:phage tail protein [Lysobacter sp. D1-1-M9]|uniref:phage tail protein n=1 Tax=Novilysobacter longmucuonensis TaxID=3098603 RepID=UPI002FC63D9D
MSEPFIGEIRLLGFSRVPRGWLPCDGGLLPIASFEALFALIGTAYGGDGASTFAVPDLRGRLPLHAGTGPGLSPRTIGQLGGSEAVTLNATQIPAHSHSITATTLAASAVTPGSTLGLGALAGDTMYVSDLTGTTAAAMSPQSTTAEGGSQAHNNVMPTLAVQYCIAAEGIFPTRP